MPLLHVSTSTRPSSGRHIQRYESTKNPVKDVQVQCNITLSIKIAENVKNINQLTDILQF
jgi:hypothetical protein